MNAEVTEQNTQNPNTLSTENSEQQNVKKHAKKILFILALIILLGSGLLGVIAYFSQAQKNLSTKRSTEENKNLVNSTPQTTETTQSENPTNETFNTVTSKQAAYTDEILGIKLNYDATIFDELITGEIKTVESTSATFVVQQNSQANFQAFHVFIGKNPNNETFTQWLLDSNTIQPSTAGQAINIKELAKTTTFSLDNKPKFAKDTYQLVTNPNIKLVGVINKGSNFILLGTENVNANDAFISTTFNSLRPINNDDSLNSTASFSLELPLLPNEFSWTSDQTKNIVSIARTAFQTGQTTKEIEGITWSTAAKANTNEDALEIVQAFRKYYEYSTWDNGWTSRKETEGYTLTKGKSESPISYSAGKIGTIGSNARVIEYKYKVNDAQTEDLNIQCPCEVALSVFVSNIIDLNTL
ncbi:MAG: hypothetical protein ACOZAO_05155 [Patescibacteria group bacterium]